MSGVPASERVEERCGDGLLAAFHPSHPNILMVPSIIPSRLLGVTVRLPAKAACAAF